MAGDKYKTVKHPRLHMTFLRFLIQSLAFLTLIVVACSAQTDRESLTSMRVDYDTSLTRIDDQYRNGLRDSLARYGRLLNTTREMLRTRGDLDGLLATEEEILRWKKEQTVPAHPPAGLPSLLVMARSSYRKQMDVAGKTRNERIIAATDRYLSRLDALKRDLTRQNRIENALSVKAEIERTRSNELVVSARTAVGSGASFHKRICLKCSGKGRTGAACNTCGKTGKCGPCGGSGTRASPFKGDRGRVRCIACSGSGKCRKCKGSGLTGETCAACKGAGTVTVRVKSEMAAAATRAADTTIDEEFEKYATVMGSLYKMHNKGQAMRADFSVVKANQAQYVGKLLKSRVYLVVGHPRIIEVVSTLKSAGKGGEQLIPYSLKVGMKVDKLFKRLGANAPVIVTYGVVSETNITIFDIAAAE